MTTGRLTTKDIEWYADELARTLAYVEFWYEQQIKALELATPSSGARAEGRAHATSGQAAKNVAKQREEARQLLRRARALGEAADRLLAQAGLPGLPSYLVPAEPDAVYTDEAYVELQQAVEQAEALAAKLGVVVPTRADASRRAAPDLATRQAHARPDEIGTAHDDQAAEGIPEPDAQAGPDLFLWGALAIAAVFACLMTIVAGVAIALLLADVFGR